MDNCNDDKSINKKEGENIEFNMLKEHVGHNISCVMYGDQNVSIECNDCNEVLHSIDK
jgi:hypothetical protein